ncbi:hypothetical protein [Microbacterium excoecariae]|uniref:hypothetical protein n=1 Tax=Microbacterium excoecariae TaxID=2715210 RepID=UPI00140C033A|nr:hypothetical protein [Microbacterium excoecariae]NHI17789.1 hypothetical protein [Microbacterium excoecariae]
MIAPLPAGILFPVEVLQSGWVAVLASFVAVNTILYMALALLKIFPAPRLTHRGRSRRAETRSIHPDDPV